MRSYAYIMLLSLYAAGAAAAAEDPPVATLDEAAGDDPVESTRQEAASRLRVLVLEPSAPPGDEEVARGIASLLAVELSCIERFDVISNADVKRIIALEGEKQSLGCSTESCVAELAGAMGANLVLFGDVTRLGEVRVVTLNLFDSQEARSLGRVSEQLTSLEQLPARIPYLANGVLERFASEHDITLRSLDAAVPVAEAPALPAWLPWTVVGVGGLGAVVGSVVSVVGFLPYLSYTDAKSRAEQATNLAAYDGALADLDRAEADYGSYGQLSVVLGLVVAGVGVAAATGGAVWALAAGGAE